MCKSCANPAKDLLKGRGRPSTAWCELLMDRFWTMDNSWVVRILSQTHSHDYTQLKRALLPLFEQVLYPVSTTPIITKKR